MLLDLAWRDWILLVIAVPLCLAARFISVSVPFMAFRRFRTYNRFTTRVERLAVRYESFSEEFSSILQRQSSSDE